MDRRRLDSRWKGEGWGDRWREDEEDEGMDGRTEENR